jgi:hypothetical protein
VLGSIVFESLKMATSQSTWVASMARTIETREPRVSLWRKYWKLWLILFGLVLPIALFSGYTWLTLHYAYSTGQRTGYIQKISKKGWLCKTWEGELAMTTVPGTAPQIFQFSVRDDATAHSIEQAAGERVSLTYQQHKGVPGSCFGETEYFVTEVHPIGQ